MAQRIRKVWTTYLSRRNEYVVRNVFVLVVMFFALVVLLFYHLRVQRERADLYRALDMVAHFSTVYQEDDLFYDLELDDQVDILLADRRAVYAEAVEALVSVGWRE